MKMGRDSAARMGVKRAFLSEGMNQCAAISAFRTYVEVADIADDCKGRCFTPSWAKPKSSGLAVRALLHLATETRSLRGVRIDCPPYPAHRFGQISATMAKRVQYCAPFCFHNGSEHCRGPMSGTFCASSICAIWLLGPLDQFRPIENIRECAHLQTPAGRAQRSGIKVGQNRNDADTWLKRIIERPSIQNIEGSTSQFIAGPEYSAHSNQAETERFSGFYLRG
jgi:hypothetical protein